MKKNMVSQWGIITPTEIAQIGIFAQINSQNAYSGVLFCYCAAIVL